EGKSKGRGRITGRVKIKKNPKHRVQKESGPRRWNWSFAVLGDWWEEEARAAGSTERQNGCCTSGSEV
ncbi:hypothetical protein E2320_005291, partial [Naja naja]